MTMVNAGLKGLKFGNTVEFRYSANRYTAISVITRSARGPRFFQGEI